MLQIAMVAVLIGLAAKTIARLRDERTSRKIIERRLAEIENLPIARRLALIKHG